jgi:hypothetical protein
MIRSKLYLLLIIISILKTSTHADEFPGDLPGIEIGGNLPNDYEPSGMVWHTGLNLLYIVDDGGDVYSMEADGSNVENIFLSDYDLEGICIADSSSNYIYLGIENPDGILELNLNTGQATRLFDLTPWMTGPGNQGLEALTFVQDTLNVEGGYFYAGLQKDGKIYKFQLPVKTSDTSTAVTYVETITPVADRSDLSGLFYDKESEVLYGIWDSDDLLRAMHSDGTYIAEWDLPGNDQEGITLWVGDGFMQRKLFIAEDAANEVWSFGFNSHLSVTIEGNGTVPIQPSVPGYYGSSIVLSAIPDFGWAFSEWSGDLSGNNLTDTIIMNNDKEVTAVFISDTLIHFNLSVFLEGPFNGTGMNSDLYNSGLVPLSQPYNNAPWNYEGTESVTAIPGSNIVDWLILEVRDAPDVSAATTATTIGQQAVFLNNDGLIVGLDGFSSPAFSYSPVNQIFVVLKHRNHICILSANALTEADGVYTYDFTDNMNKAFGGIIAQKEIATGVWGMIGGDADGNGQIDNNDKNELWIIQNGTSGYLEADYNMTGTINSLDTDIWINNSGKGTQEPD